MNKDIIIRAGMTAIPHVGGSLAALYFGAKQEKRFRRLEEFYEKAQEQLSENPVDQDTFDKHNQDDLENLIEELHSRVEAESRESKRELLRNFFISTLRSPINGDFDERNSFLLALDSMSELECSLLAFLKSQTEPVQIRNLTGADTYVLYAGVNKLVSLGFIETRRGSYTMNGMQDENLDDLVFLSGYGKRFADYIS